jgi:hypothetical protein
MNIPRYSASSVHHPNDLHKSINGELSSFAFGEIINHPIILINLFSLMFPSLGGVRGGIKTMLPMK